MLGKLEHRSAPILSSLLCSLISHVPWLVGPLWAFTTFVPALRLLSFCMLAVLQTCARTCGSAGSIWLHGCVTGILPLWRCATTTLAKEVRQAERAHPPADMQE